MIADYFAVDVETANQNRHSICQIGIAAFVDGKMVDAWQTLVNPSEYFHGINISIHGIRPEMVADAPCWPEVFEWAARLLDNAVVASHTAFDRGALLGACERNDLPPIAYRKWIDTCWIARKAWPELPNHKLPTLAGHFAIVYKSHDALEDARVAGEILALALDQRQLSITELLADQRPHITGFPKASHRRRNAEVCR